MLDEVWRCEVRRSRRIGLCCHDRSAADGALCGVAVVQDERQLNVKTSRCNYASSKPHLLGAYELTPIATTPPPHHRQLTKGRCRAAAGPPPPPGCGVAAAPTASRHRRGLLPRQQVCPAGRHGPAGCVRAASAAGQTAGWPLAAPRRRLQLSQAVRVTHPPQTAAGWACPRCCCQPCWTGLGGVSCGRSCGLAGPAGACRSAAPPARRQRWLHTKWPWRCCAAPPAAAAAQPAGCGLQGNKTV